jgi:hypothetical protein
MFRQPRFKVQIEEKTFGRQSIKEWTTQQRRTGAFPCGGWFPPKPCQPRTMGFSSEPPNPEQVFY